MDDETFVRQIVESPEDTLLRLAYADWLEERGDLRGAYLRAEREAFESGDAAPLRELGTGLDPVWVARVSLPPVGVCCAPESIIRRGDRIDSTEIAQVEERLGIRFPADYKGFLLNYNGGSVGYHIMIDGNPSIVEEFEWWFQPIHKVRPLELRPNETPEDPEAVREWLSRFVYIGYDPDFIGGILLGVRPPVQGEIRIIDTSVDLESGFQRYQAGEPPTATNFAELLSRL